MVVKYLNGKQMRDFLLEQGYYATDVAAYAYGNFTEAVANIGKGALTAQTGERIGSGAFKAIKYFSRGDVVCGTLCSVSIGCETACVFVTWVPMSYAW